MRGLYRRAGRLKLILTATLVCMLLMMVYQMMVTTEEEDEYEQYHNSDRQIKSSYTYDSERSSDPVYYDKSVPLIWVGGVPRSGTTLARAMLDAHPDIRCGEETRIIPRLLAMHGHLLKSDKEMARLREAKITEGIMDDALGAYLLSIIVKHGEPAQRLCNKDPFALKSIPKLLKIFPKSKFILMVRDGRATVHSIISRKVTIRGFDTKTYRGALRDWNRAAETMYVQCLSAGKDTCLVVHYEQLVLHPESQMRRILKFLGVPWNNIVIHHEDAVGKGGGISLSKKELSTDQVVKPVNTGALSKWANFIPQDVRDDIHNIAPMLQKLGYDPDQYPPEYGTPDRIVQEHSDSLHMSQKARQIERLRNSSL